MPHLKLIITFSSLPLLVALFTSCEDNASPALSDVPQIELAKVEFVEVGGLAEPDSLILSINFTDGDANLGLPNRLDSPFHHSNFFLEDGSPSLIKLASFEDDYYFTTRVKAHGQPGKLVTVRTRNEPGMEFLPVYESNTCFFDISFPYQRTTLYISEEDKYIIDLTYNITDTLRRPSHPDMYVVHDTFYVERNPFLFNIEVDFLVADQDGNFTEFEWTPYNCISYDGRFPEIENLGPGHNLVLGPFRISGLNDRSGTIRYAMTSTGFLQLFENKTLKLRIKIRDRDLNDSNVLETPPFTLEDIN